MLKFLVVSNLNSEIPSGFDLAVSYHVLWNPLTSRDGAFEGWRAEIAIPQNSKKQKKLFYLYG
jgi:hypothetical protein